MSISLPARTVVCYKGGDNCTLAYHEYDRICAAWESGDKFFDSEDEYGAVCKISLRGVRRIWHFTEENRQQYRADELALKKEDSLFSSE